jgi:hypothetical protein
VLAFSVKDTGTGIDPEYIDMLFEPFSQADTSSTRKYEGHRAGVEHLQAVGHPDGRRHRGGKQPGVGSTFFFFVRMQRFQVPTPHCPATGHPPGHSGPERPGGRRHGRQPDDHAQYAGILLGFRVETLSSGPEH